MTFDPGFVFNDADNGTLFLASDKNTKKRPRQVQLASASGGSLKLFDNGGFELMSNGSADLADNILSQSTDGLKIHSKGDLNISTDGRLTISASQIIFDSKSATRDFVIKNENGNIRIEASAGNVGIKGNNVVVAASRNVILKSKGNIHAVADGGQIFIVEPKSKLLPTNVLDIVTKVLSTLEGWS